MKYVFLPIAALMVSVAGFSQDKPKTLEGNGKLVTRDIPVKSFTELKASGIYELKLSQGSTESVKIEADENLQEFFEVKNEGSKLVINTKKMENRNLKIKTKLRVYVTFKTLKDLDLTTIGNVTSDNQLTFTDVNIANKSVGNVDLKLTANKITFENSSVGNVTLSGKADDAVFKNSGVGSMKAGDFLVQTMNIENTGVGNAEVNAEKQLKVQDSFLGKVKNKGSAPTKKSNKVVI
jgi:hypothetical protein